MNRIRPRTTVLSGVAIGLVAGVAAYGVASTSATAKPTQVTKVAPASAIVPASAPLKAPVKVPARRHCAKGVKLEKGVCTIHVVKVVRVERVVHIPRVDQAQQANTMSSSSRAGASQNRPAGAARTQTRTALAAIRAAAPRSGEAAEPQEKEIQD